MPMNKITGTIVGADLSRPALIYRPSVAFTLSLFCCIPISYEPHT
jgi:hypothetical protein